MQTYIQSVIEKHIEETLFLFATFQNELAEDSPDKTYLKDTSERLSAHLDGLVINLDAAWPLCEASMEDELDAESSAFFVASFLAFQSEDLERIKAVVEASETSAESLAAVAFGLAWHPWDKSGFWAQKFVGSQKVGIASIGQFCYATYQQTSPEPLNNTCKRAVSENHIAAVDLISVVAQKTNDQSVIPLIASITEELPHQTQLQICKARLSLADASVLDLLKVWVMAPGPLREEAVLLAFGYLTPEQAKTWMAELKGSEESERYLLLAVGAMNEQNLLPWVIKQMHQPALARIAGKVFCQLTGANLAAQGWTITDGSMDEYWLELDGDEELDWPDAAKIEREINSKS